MKIRTVLAGVLAAAALPLTLPGSSTAAPAPAPEIRVKTAQGLDACPTAHLCLYEHEQYNASGPARIWLFGNNGAADKVEYNLDGRQPAHKGRSAYNNTKLYTVQLRDQWTIEESTDIIQLAAGHKLASLNVTGDNGGARLASTTPTKPEGTYLYEYKPQAVNLNDHVGSVNLDNAPPPRHGHVTHHHGHGPVPGSLPVPLPVVQNPGAKP
ncbi:peptidase inhibitor family I36 protein [Streptomyces sp. NPDC058304]|uniref:peptidase inhibitor family I36 protein n=1 Tax=Streptomyces sp. NPDC058304 TaxID=3346437 RepID=UPI0036EA7DC7